MQIEIGRSVTYPFDDPSWAPKLIAFLILGFVPGLNIIMWSGYAISIARNIARGAPTPMPGWDDWTAIGVRGLQGVFATVIYFSPAVFGLCCLVVGSALFGPRAESLFLTLRCMGVGLALLYGLATNYLLTCGHLRYAQTEQFAVYLDLGGRLRDLRGLSRVTWPLFVYQMALSVILTLLSIVAVGIFLVALSAIATTDGLIVVLVVALLAVALVGYTAIVTLAFLANGYILGAAGVAIRHAPPN